LLACPHTHIRKSVAEVPRLLLFDATSHGSRTSNRPAR
jgi:hypothetical protein